jgi:hypothetical protein
MTVARLNPQAFTSYSRRIGRADDADVKRTLSTDPTTANSAGPQVTQLSRAETVTITRHLSAGTLRLRPPQ